MIYIVFLEHEADIKRISLSNSRYPRWPPRYYQCQRNWQLAAIIAGQSLLPECLIRRSYPVSELTGRASEVSHTRHAVVHSSLMARDDCLTVVAAAEEMFTRRDLFELVQRPVRGLDRSSVVLIQTEYNALLCALVLPAM